MRSRSASYRLYGLSLQSPLVLPCPRASPARAKARPRVSLVPATSRRFAGLGARGIRVPNARDWFRCRRLADGTQYLRWAGLFEFLISPDGHRIHYRRLRHASRESFSSYLLSQVLSFSLIAFGSEPLHGTVVVAGGEAVGFLGDCGYGKSTLAAAFLARGLPVLTDDLIVLVRNGPGFRVHPGVPRLKLFPAVSRAVLGSGVGARMNPGTAKLVLPLVGAQVFRRPAPLRALYVLSDPTLPTDRIAIEPLSQSRAMIEIVSNTFNTIVTDRERLANQFRFAQAVAGAVPVKGLAYPRELSALPDVCDAILSDLSR